MTRSVDFADTVKRGVRAAQPDLVVHARRDPGSPVGPKIGLVVSKAVGNSVDRNRVSRRLRHCARNIVSELEPDHRIVVRALAGSSNATSPLLQRELQTGVQRALELLGGQR